MANTNDPAPAFAELAGFAAKNQKRFPASHARDSIGVHQCGSVARRHETGGSIPGLNPVTASAKTCVCLRLRSFTRKILDCHTDTLSARDLNDRRSRVFVPLPLPTWDRLDTTVCPRSHPPETIDDISRKTPIEEGRHNEYVDVTPAVRMATGVRAEDHCEPCRNPLPLEIPQVSFNAAHNRSVNHCSTFPALATYRSASAWVGRDIPDSGYRPSM
jgi:hypothetical protein